MKRLIIAAFVLLLAGRAQSAEQDRKPGPKKPHDSYLSQCFCDWRCDCPKCLHIRECIAEVRQEMIDAREGKESKLPDRDKEFIATVHKLEQLLKGGPDDPPLSPVRGPGERDPYARFKNYVLRSDSKTGKLYCSNCEKEYVHGWKFCPECGARVAGNNSVLAVEVIDDVIEILEKKTKP